MILLLDNYDSFTWNLFHYLQQLTDEKVVVKRNDEISVEDAAAYSSIVLSPGPGLPAEAGILKDLIKEYAGSKPILGICLGLQAIAEVFGGKLFNLEGLLHGVSRKTCVIDDDDPIFRGLPNEFYSGHYHSWAVSAGSLPKDLVITARDQDGIIMAIKHATLQIHGLQFHPESVMTEYGLKMLSNWLTYCRNR